MDTFDLKFSLTQDLLATPQGIAALSLLLLLFILAAAIRPTRWVVIVALLYLCNVNRAGTDAVGSDDTLITPLRQLAPYTRPLCSVILFMLIPQALMAARGWRHRLLPAAAWAYFAFRLVIGLIDALRGGVFGWTQVVVFVPTFLCLGLGLSKWMQHDGDLRNAVRCIVAQAALFLVGTVGQVILMPSGAVAFGRFQGTTSNPIMAGLICALALPPTCYLLISRRATARQHVGLITMIGLMVVVLGWSGSRTPAAMALAGILLFFRLRLGKFLLIGGTAAVVALVGFQTFSQSGDVASRLLSVQDTRSEVWSNMVADFVENPAVGTKHPRAGSENAYLLAASHYGLVGVVPLALSMLLAARDLFQLHRQRRQLGDYVLVLDLVTAILGMVAIGSLFDGMLIGMFSLGAFCTMISLCIMGYLADVAAVIAAERLAPGATPVLYEERPAWSYA